MLECVPKHGRGGPTLETTALFVANMLILWVMALVLGVAGRGRGHEPWWKCWALANLVLGAALGVFVLERSMPPLLVALLPNGLLVLGLGLRWRAARQFGHRPAPAALVWGPLALFVICAAPFAGIAYAPVFTATNVLLTALALVVTWEFWRDRQDGLASRYGLIASYAAIALSFGWRVPIGIFQAGAMPAHLPLDMALVIHLTVALFHTVASGAFALSLAYERTNAELRHAATHDALTGLLNRGAFEARLRGLLGKAADAPFAVALLDIDRFKQINDRFGHAAGDAALRRCAALCGEAAGAGSTVARIGGEEFAIILEDVDERQATAAVERIRKAVGSSPVEFGASRFRITISGGISHSAAAPAGFDELMRLADARLYEAKNNGRNRITGLAA